MVALAEDVIWRTHELQRELIDSKSDRKGTAIVATLGHGEAIMRAVLAGLGVALLFRSSIEEELASASLEVIAIPGLKIVVPIYLIKRT